MQTLFSFTPAVATIGIIALIVLIRKRSELRQWWNVLCDDAECSSITAQLYQTLEHHEHQLLLEHAQAGTIKELGHHTSPTLAALAHDLQDYINPLARLQAIQQAIERREIRRSQPRANLAH